MPKSLVKLLHYVEFPSLTNFDLRQASKQQLLSAVSFKRHSLIVRTFSGEVQSKFLFVP